MKKLFGPLCVLAIVIAAGLRIATAANVERYVSPTGTQIYNLDDSGNVSIGGTLATTGATTNTGAVTNSSTATNSGKTVFTKTTITGVFASTTIVPTSTFYVLTSSSPAALIQMTSTPTISTTTATDGQYLVLKSTSATATIVLVDQGTLAGSLLELGASTRTISDLKVLTLLFDSLQGKWIELSYGNN